MKNKKITHNLARVTMTLLALLCCLTGAWAQRRVPSFTTKEITGYGEGEGYYYLIASPVGEVYPTDVINMLNDDIDLIDLYSFDQNGEEGLEWRNYKAESFNLESGKGYLYASKDDVTLTFTGTPNTGEDVTIELDYSENAEFSGWNLVGNPFAASATVNRPFYKMNAEGTGFISFDAMEEVGPMEGIFVVAEAEGETAKFRPKENEVKRLNFALNISQSKGIIDRAIVSFDESRLLPKFQLKETSTKIFIPQENGDFALVRGKAIDQLPVSFKAQRDGSYTLSLSDTEVKFNYFHLVDLLTGNDVDLLANPSYTFNARSTDDASRFRLDYAANNVTSAISPIRKELTRGMYPKLPPHGLEGHQDAGAGGEDPEVPPTPTDLIVYDITATQATLSWIEIGDADKWVIQLWSNEEDRVEIEVEVEEGSTYTLDGLTPETTYRWQVQSWMEDSSSDWSEVCEFTTEEQTNVTQTIPLVAGWNWFSTNVEIGLDNLKAALVEALPGATNIVISSNTQNTTYNGSRWRGQLNSLDVSQMYMIKVPVDCEISLEGMPIDPAEHPVTIKPDENWIGFPGSQEMSVSDAFAGFAVERDMIISQTGFAVFNGTIWRGTLTTLEPGKGYIYKSKATNEKTFTFPISF